MKKCLNNNRGAVLITGLIILVVLSVIGLVAMQSTTLQERMAGNLEQRDAAFQRAESGLRAAEAWLNNTVILPGFHNNTKGLYTAEDAGDSPWWKELDWKDDNAVIAYQDGNVIARYIVEYAGEVDVSGNDSVKLSAVMDEGAGMYRITSRGESPNGRVEVILQTTFVR